MKSYNHLWEEFVSYRNIALAVKNASKSKKNRKSVKKWLNDRNLIPKIRRYAENFHNAKHTPKQIYDGIQRKKRTIIVPTFLEQVIHHMAVNVLKPIFMRGMYEHSYGSIPNRGGHKGMKRIEKWIKHGGKECKYCLKMDIRKYFESIPHDIYLAKLRKLIHDKRFMGILEELTSVIPNEKGIPLGFYLSQWTANWYLQDLDHYIKEQLRARYYIRYMDDMVIFGSNKRKLHKIRIAVKDYLRDRLGLEMKSNWQVFLFDYTKNGKSRGRPLDFMGFKFYRNRIILRKSIMIKATRKAKRIHKADKPSVYTIRQVMAYLGWIDATDTYRMYENHIKPYVNIQQCKRRISAFDRRQKGAKNDIGVEKNRMHEQAA